MVEGTLKQKAKKRKTDGGLLGEAGLGVGGALNQLQTAVGKSKGVGAVYNYSMSQKQEKRFGQYTSPGGM